VADSKDGAETLSVDRAFRAMRRADIAVMVIDGSEGITVQVRRGRDALSLSSSLIQSSSLTHPFSLLKHPSSLPYPFSFPSSVLTQDFKLSEMAAGEGSGMVVVVNKWDRVDPNKWTEESFTEEVQAQLRHVSWASVVCTTASEGEWKGSTTTTASFHPSSPLSPPQVTCNLLLLSNKYPLSRAP
jgi:GTP-binding protein